MWNLDVYFGIRVLCFLVVMVQCEFEIGEDDRTEVAGQEQIPISQSEEASATADPPTSQNADPPASQKAASATADPPVSQEAASATADPPTSQNADPPASQRAASATADPPISQEAASATADHPKIPKEFESNFPKEFELTAHLRPTKCQVCRILTTELQSELIKTKDAKVAYSIGRFDGDQKTIDYKKSTMRLLDTLDGICINVYKYRPFFGPEFPYLRGVKSMFRASLEKNAGKKKYTRDTAPSDLLIEDPTKEMRRMSDDCRKMVEAYEDDITDWYHHKQEVDPVDFLCAERIVDSDKQDCLRASTEVPEGMEQPVLLTEEEKRMHHPVYNRKVEL